MFMFDISQAIQVGQMVINGTAPLFTISPAVMIALGIVMILFLSRFTKYVVQVVGFLLIVYGILAVIGFTI